PAPRELCRWPWPRPRGRRHPPVRNNRDLCVTRERRSVQARPRLDEFAAQVVLARRLARCPLRALAEVGADDGGGYRRRPVERYTTGVFGAWGGHPGDRTGACPARGRPGRGGELRPWLDRTRALPHERRDQPGRTVLRHE